MIIESKKARRIGIYSFYEKDGIVDRYVEFFLDGFRKDLEKLVIVSNGRLPKTEKRKLQAFTEFVIERENKGFDIWGIREGLLSVGWKELSAYDEVVTANNTLMGPVYPLSGMYAEMKARDVDFWGIARHYEMPFDPFGTNEYGYLPEHIQSYFMVFRKSMTDSEPFRKYWEELPELNSYEDAVGRHETAFTKKFADQGFRWDTYLDTEDIRQLNANPIMNYPMLLVKEKRCPVFKRRIFFQDYKIVLDATVGQPAYDLYNYLKESGLYDVDMIWENILRTCHQSDFGKNLHLDYILPGKGGTEEDGGKLSGRKTALFAGIRHMESSDAQLAYVLSMPKTADIYLLTDTEEHRNTLLEKTADWKFHKLEIRISKAEYAGEMSLLADVEDVLGQYEICCFYHDSRVMRLHQGAPEESRQYKRAVNTLYSESFVQNVLKKFEEEPRLGLLLPPEANHERFFSNIGDEWHTNFKTAWKVMKLLDIRVPVSESREPLTSGENAFWFRPEALRKVTGKQQSRKIMEQLKDEVAAEEVPGLLRLFAVQEAGFFPAVVMSDVYARNEFDNLRYYVRNYNQVIKRNHLPYGTQRDMTAHLNSLCSGKKIQVGIPFYMRFAERMRRLLPHKLYGNLIYIKRRIFGPYDLIDKEDM